MYFCNNTVLVNMQLCKRKYKLNCITCYFVLFSNSRMGNFEQELFTVVDAILDLLGQRPSVTRTTSVQDVTKIDRSPGTKNPPSKLPQSLSLALPRYSPSYQLADAAVAPPESHVKRPCVAELGSDWTDGV